ncbi:chloride channel protein C-like [Rhincodon typus]|uniref:chloride channel protein C-like n=1 Tax=Rhincodon typus TaxID=259920 RepID=UPI00202FB631|nr:chloride channel protein C-like [Rhincodon typus]
MTSLHFKATRKWKDPEEHPLLQQCRRAAHKHHVQKRNDGDNVTNVKWTQNDRENLALHESLDYLPSHSDIYKKWLQRKPYRSDWDYWFMMGLIGISIGVLGFLVNQTIDILVKLKWKLILHYIQNNQFFLTWIWLVGIGLAMVTISSGTVLIFCPSGMPSGLPEVIGFLNGASIQGIFRIKTLFGTLVSCVLAVASGLFCGPEGPMIYMGSILGSGLSQFKSDTFGVQFPFFTRFRNCADRRNFITAGAGAGIASVFRAPMGGLLFTFEEVASFWDLKLAWQTLFCCLMAALTTDLLSSSFHGFVYQGHFGFFKAEESILFGVKYLLDMNILVFIPTIILGIIGGLLGALFVSMNLRVNKFRTKFFKLIKYEFVQKVCKLTEAVLTLIITITATVYVPYFFPCSPPATASQNQSSSKHKLDGMNASHLLSNTEYFNSYNCPSGTTWIGSNGVKHSNHTYNQAAALLFGNGQDGIVYLFRRGTPEEFGYAALFTTLIIYYLFSCWTAGTAMACGLVIPMLYTGALYGRIIGLIMVSMFGVRTDKYGAWIDPGLFAIIGAASYFCGVSRLTISLTAIMVELTNDVQSLLPIMVAVMVARMTGDLFNRSLYSSLLKQKCIPFLEPEPRVLYQNKPLNLELFTVKDVMERQVKVLHLREKVSSLATLLLETKHCGFPVIYHMEQAHEEVFIGSITRLELYRILENGTLFETQNDESCKQHSQISYNEVRLPELLNSTKVNLLLNEYRTDIRYKDCYVNLKPYINQSAMTVHANFSLQRTYTIFRTVGLRHLTVVDLRNHILGIITRKDLMAFQLEEKLLQSENLESENDRR